VTVCAAIAQHVEHLRQIQLALRVLSAQSRQRSSERRSVEHEDAGVHLVDGELRGRAVAGHLGLDHALHRAARVAHDPPVARRVLEHRRHHRGHGSAFGVRVDQPADRLGADQRHISAEDDDRRLWIGERGV